MAGELVTVEPAQLGPEELILKAIENNVPVESLERLLALRQTLKAEQAREMYIDAMAAFQAECPVIAKATQADRYSYAKLEAIVEQTAALRAIHGFSYKFNTRQTGDQEIVECVVSHRAGHSETAEFRMMLGSIPGLTPMQQSGAAHSYAKRYAFCDAFGIVTGDDDTDADGPNQRPQQVTRPTAAAQATQRVTNNDGELLERRQACPNCLTSHAIHQKRSGSWYCAKREGGCGQDFAEPIFQLGAA